MNGILFTLSLRLSPSLSYWFLFIIKPMASMVGCVEKFMPIKLDLIVTTFKILCKLKCDLLPYIVFDEFGLLTSR